MSTLDFFKCQPHLERVTRHSQSFDYLESPGQPLYKYARRVSNRLFRIVEKIANAAAFPLRESRRRAAPLGSAPS